jgi:hypothetical protein
MLYNIVLFHVLLLVEMSKNIAENIELRFEKFIFSELLESRIERIINSIINFI